jgi:hypothetical protein
LWGADDNGHAGGRSTDDVWPASARSCNRRRDGARQGPGRIGYAGRSDYTAIGNVVNLASRICGAAEDGQILMDAVVAAEIGDALPLVPLGSRLLRGLTEPLSVFSAGPADPNLTKLPAAKELAVQRSTGSHKHHKRSDVFARCGSIQRDAISRGRTHGRIDPL